MKKVKTVHTSRTIMFAELEKVMNHSVEDDSYLESMKQNVINKQTNSGIKYTTSYLKKLYSFNTNHAPFKVFKYFWQISDNQDKSKLALLYAVGSDYLIAESIPVVVNTKPGDKVTIEKMEENIETFYPGKYSDNTRKSMAQNIASSWKQAGFITGKVKNIRTQPEISYNVVAFAFLMAYLHDLRGDFILKSNWVKALGLNEQNIRELAIEAAQRDLLQYQFAGNVTSISFNNLLNKLEIDGI